MSVSDELLPGDMLQHQPDHSEAGTADPANSAGSNLRATVHEVVRRYLEQMDDDDAINDLYQLVLHEVEAPLLAVVLEHTASNQSKASMLLGLNRGTLRKKMKQHGLL